MALTHTYSIDRPTGCGSRDCMERAGQQAKELVRRNTERITREAAEQTMKAKVAQETMEAAIRVHLDRIVALELEVQRLRLLLPANTEA